MGLLNSPISSTRFATVTFIECELRGLWNKLPDDFNPSKKLEPGWEYYRVEHKDGQEIWLVRPDDLRRAWKFRYAAIVKLGQNSIQFDHDDILEELAVDEDAQKGKPRKSTVV